MKKIMRYMVICVSVCLPIALCLPANGQDQTKRIIQTVVQAEVVKVMAEKSTLVVKQPKDPANKTYEEASIILTPGINIVKGPSNVGLSKVKPGDKVQLQYVGELGNLKLEKIIIRE